MGPASAIMKKLSDGLPPNVAIPINPGKEDIREEVLRLKQQGLCGRRIGQQFLGPYFIASDQHGQREIELLEEILEEEYEKTNFCIQERQAECSRLRGGCKGAR